MRSQFIALLTCTSLISVQVMAQTTSEPIRPIEVQQQSSAQQVFLPANTEVILSMNDDLTTKGGAAEEGTTFGLTVVSDVKLGPYVVIPKGSRGTGEVTWKTGKGAFGKSGKMEIELRSIDVGGQRIPIEGKYRQEGEGNTVATVGTVILAGVFAGFVTGKSARIPRGRELAARTKEPIPVVLPAGAVIPSGIQATAIGAPAQSTAQPTEPAQPAQQATPAGQ